MMFAIPAAPTLPEVAFWVSAAVWGRFLLRAGGDGLSLASCLPFSSCSACLLDRRLRGGSGVSKDSCPCPGLCDAGVGDALSTTPLLNWCCAATLALARLAGHHCNKDSNMVKPSVFWWIAFWSNP